MLIEIEKNIPFPPKKSRKYPIREMEVGDSFFVRKNSTNKKRNREVTQMIHSAISAFKKRNKLTELKFTMRSCKAPIEGVRCWRIK